MTDPLRIDQAIAPFRLTKNAVAYSLFITPEGLYAIKTGPGWRMQVRGFHRNERMVENARQVEVLIDPGNLAGELEYREGSFFVPAADIADIKLGRRFDTLPDLRFTDGTRKYRVQFDEGHDEEIKAFVRALSSLPGSVRPESDDGLAKPTFVLFEGKQVRTVALPSPCWGATPHIALAGGQVFVRYLAPTGKHHAEKFVVYRLTYDEQCDIVFGREETLQRCQRLVGDAWGTPPPPVSDAPFTESAEARSTASTGQIDHALALCIARRLNAERDVGRGGSAEQVARHDDIQHLEFQQATFEWALQVLR